MRDAVRKRRKETSVKRIYPELLHVLIGILLLAGVLAVLIGLPAFLLSDDYLLYHVGTMIIMVAASLCAFAGAGLVGLAAVWHWGARCRIITVTDRELRRGLIHPARIRWEEVSAWGTGFFFPQYTGTNLAAPGKRQIYVVSGPVSEEEIRTYGIGQIWTWRCAKRYLPFLCPLLARMEQKGGTVQRDDLMTGDRLVMPRQIIWVRYTPELYREIKMHIADNSNEGR